MPSTKTLQDHRRGSGARWLPRGWLPALLARLDSAVESTRSSLGGGKPLISSQDLMPSPSTGFRVDSPVKKPVASELPGCAPPYTFGSGEEPWEGAECKLLFAGSWRSSRVAKRWSFRQSETMTRSAVYQNPPTWRHVHCIITAMWRARSACNFKTALIVCRCCTRG
jgi:hypothetical protein